MTLPLVLLLIMAHEAGHWLVGRSLGLPARFGYVLRPFPFPVVRMPATTRGETILIALAGPVVNLALVWPLWATGQKEAAFVAVDLGLISLIPFPRQDGRRILDAWRNHGS